MALGEVVAFAAPDAEAGELLQMGLVQALWQAASGRQEMQARQPTVSLLPPHSTVPSSLTTWCGSGFPCPCSVHADLNARLTFRPVLTGNLLDISGSWVGV